MARARFRDPWTVTCEVLGALWARLDLVADDPGIETDWVPARSLLRPVAGSGGAGRSPRSQDARRLSETRERRAASR